MVISNNHKSLEFGSGGGGGNDDDDDDDIKGKILVIINGQDAKKILTELENGHCINFRVSVDENNGNDPIVYLYKS